MDQVSEIVFFWGYYNKYPYISTKVENGSSSDFFLDQIVVHRYFTIVLCFEKSSNLPKKMAKTSKKNSRF